MDNRVVVRWIVFSMLLGMLAGCGRMLPMGGRDELIKYTVKKSETLYSISWRYGYDHREVAAWNNIKPVKSKNCVHRFSPLINSLLPKYENAGTFTTSLT